jgi:hypothetical protein
VFWKLSLFHHQEDTLSTERCSFARNQGYVSKAARSLLVLERCRPANKGSLVASALLLGGHHWFQPIASIWRISGTFGVFPSRSLICSDITIASGIHYPASGTRHHLPYVVGMYCVLPTTSTVRDALIFLTSAHLLCIPMSMHNILHQTGCA